MNIKQLTIKTIALFAIVLLTVIPVQAANKPTLNRVEPPFWWTGFKNPSLQLMVYGERISETK
ncbi:MAG TPA: cyclomaltodextrinase N-terminal domain-containing protein, partial [Prolixibacteraceae bacterium]|nr:cyclomaltodextrinase N-terminal domain-containing protein [Prolixibacteraceae bacterium]